MAFGPLTFLSPWLLLALAALPILWWLLRAVPPAPSRVVFPGVRLLLGLDETDRMPARTPWWLLLLRMVALALVILGFARPVLNPQAEQGEGALVVLLDGGWGDAPDWPARMDRVAGALAAAARDGRPAAVLSMADEPPPDDALPLRAASDWSERLAGMEPRPWSPVRADWADWFADREEVFETLWLGDGLDAAGSKELLDVLLEKGVVTYAGPSRPVRALTPPRIENDEMTVTVLRPDSATDAEVSVRAVGPDPNGVERVLGTGSGVILSGETSFDLSVRLPVELRNRVTRLELDAGRSAAGVVLADDAVRRRKVGLVSGEAGTEAQDLTDPLNYLRKAMEPFARTVEGPLTELLQAIPDVMILADIGGFADSEREALTGWVEEGGVLIRFAGPRLAQSGAGQLDGDPLLPVRLRAGGRSVGGAMSWGAPRRLRPFSDDGPFAGLDVPADVEISAQVMAQPDPELPQRVLASLEDGTPLVTGKPLGAGRVVLFHVTASADWSNLPLSGLFVSMLERLAQGAGAATSLDPELIGAVWAPVQVLDGFGVVETPGMVAGVPGERLAAGMPGLDAPPGIYSVGERYTAFNVIAAGEPLIAMPALPPEVRVEAMEKARERLLAPLLLALALILLMADVLVTLQVSGRLTRAGPGAARSAAVWLLGVALLATGAEARAQEAEFWGANETVLAYVQTGNARQDRVSEAGMRGLSKALFQRTSIEPGDPAAVNIETDELSLLPLLYWPVNEGQRALSDEAYARLNTYLRNGGMILFDTLDSDLGKSFAGTTPNGRALQRIALRLDIPPLAPVPADHVLTRTFYLLQDFPGRFYDSPVWVEAPRAAETVEGLPFRNLNDGVTPVVIGGNDWASAWAVQENGQPMFPVGRGLAGERQREMALRFGVNLVMYVMTGNYKSDQVHVPALLDRLGQ